MTVECIEKPNGAEYTETAVTVGKKYHVINKDDDDYKLIDDN